MRKTRSKRVHCNYKQTPRTAAIYELKICTSKNNTKMISGTAKLKQQQTATNDKQTNDD